MNRHKRKEETEVISEISRHCDIWMDAITKVLPIPQFALDNNHRIIYWNEALEKYSGIKASEVIGTNRGWQAFYPDERPCLADLLIDGMENRIPELYEGKYKKSLFIKGAYEATDFIQQMGKSGVWLHLTSAAIRDEKGEIIGAVETLQDISGIKKAEKALSENEAYIRTVLDNLPIGISVNSLDPEISFEYFNENFLKYYRTTAEALLKPDLFWDAIYKDPFFGEGIQKRVPEDSASSDPKETYWEDIPIIRSGEETTYVSARNIPLPGKKMVISTVWDVTESKRAEDELKKSQMKLAEAMDLAHLVNWEYDVIKDIFTFNDRFYTFHGTTEELEGGYLMSAEEYGRRFVYPDDQYLVADEVKKAMETTDPGYVAQIEHRIVRRDGEIRYIVVRFGIVKDKNGVTIKTHGANQDITERVKTQKALSIANKKLNMLSSITRHDILNLIMVVRGYLELSEGIDDETILKRYIVKEKEAVDAIEHQIEFTRYYQDIGVTEPQWQNPGKIITKVSRSLDLKDIKLENSLNDLEIFADPLIEKVFYNLIENTIRHGGHVTLISLSYSETDSEIIISYRDNGGGIADAQRKMLFKKGGGIHTGLGLFLSREILSITNITIEENGEPGEGVNFEITVPKGNYRINSDKN